MLAASKIETKGPFVHPMLCQGVGETEPQNGWNPRGPVFPQCSARHWGRKTKGPFVSPMLCQGIRGTEGPDPLTRIEPQGRLFPQCPARALGEQRTDTLTGIERAPSMPCRGIGGTNGPDATPSCLSLDCWKSPQLVFL